MIKTVDLQKLYKTEEAAKLNLDVRSQWPAILVIGIGVMLLGANLFHIHLINVLWPGFIIAPGLMLLTLMWYGATSCAMLFIMSITPPFEAA